MSDSLQLLAETVGRGLEPVINLLIEGDTGTATFIRQLGFLTEPVPPIVATLPASATALQQALRNLDAARAAAAAGVGPEEDVDTALAAVFAAVVGLAAVVKVIGSQATGLPGFEDRFYEFVLVSAVEALRPALASLLVLLGIFTRTAQPIIQDGEPAEVIVRGVRFDRISLALRDPSGLFGDVYGWGTNEIDSDLLFKNVSNLASFLGLAFRIEYPTEESLTAFGVGVADEEQLPRQLVVPLGVFPGGEIAADVFPLPTASPTEPQGLAFTIELSAAAEETLEISDRVSLTVIGTGEAQTGVGLLWRPNTTPQLVRGVLGGGGAPVAKGGVSVQLTRTGFNDPAELQAPEETLASVGNGSAITAEAIGVIVGASIDSHGTDVSVGAFVRKGKIVVSAGDGDGFLTKLLPSSPMQAQFEAGVTWSRREGVHFSISAGLEVAIPINATFGPVTISTLRLRGDIDGKVNVRAAIDANAKLGPVTVAISGIGAELGLAFQRGNLGIFDASAGFVPPSGVGIFIETSSVSGGGFLFFDPDNGRYGGALELRAYDIDIKAFGLIETKVPGVSFSFVIMISAEFNPIQLGFGITLDGVGGLIGINRTVDSKVLASRVRDGTLDNVLFPTNLIQNAPALIGQLATLFPAAADHHVFGPIAKLGWARIVHGTIGLIFELPSKALSIIGNINAILPKPDNPIVVLDMDIGGKLDFPKKHFELDATLSPNSKVGAYTISGDMATRIDWGDRPNFAISMGGFHSQFTPPPGFPSLRRMSIALGINGNPSVTLQGFMALTSNTAQIGARLDVYASFGATLTGSVGFEALFVFSPFSFDARMWGNVHVEFLGVGFGMTLDGRIRGPSPWIIDGEVCVSLWFDSACVGIHKTLDGAPAPLPLPSLDPWFGDPAQEAVLSKQRVPGLKAAILDISNWAGRLPPNVLIGVTYVERKEKDRPPVDPVGIATFRQKAVPLQYEITRFAGTTPSPKRNLQIASVTAGNSAASVAYVTDWFAPGQYRKMSNDEALAAKPFEQLKAGVELQSAVIKTGTVRNRPVTYRTTVLDVQGNVVTTPAQESHELPLRHFGGLVQSTSASRLSARLTGRARFVDIRQQPRITDALETFTLRSKSDFGVVDGITNVTRSEAAAALDAKAGTSTFNRQQYEIVGTYLAA